MQRSKDALPSANGPADNLQVPQLQAVRWRSDQRQLPEEGSGWQPVSDAVASDEGARRPDAGSERSSRIAKRILIASDGPPRWRLESVGITDSPVGGIVRMAAEYEVDLVVVDAHGLSGSERVRLGSVARRVSAQAPCAIRVARPSRHGEDIGRDRGFLCLQRAGRGVGSILGAAAFAIAAFAPCSVEAIRGRTQVSDSRRPHLT